jgi:hypothetical protein
MKELVELGPSSGGHGEAEQQVARAGIEPEHGPVVDIALTRPRDARRRPSGTRPSPGACRRIPGSGRTAAAGGGHTTPGGPGRASAALAFHQRRIGYSWSSCLRSWRVRPPVRGGPRCRRWWPESARGLALGNLACGPAGRPHNAMRRTSPGRGDNPGPGLPATVVEIVFEADGRLECPGHRVAGWCEQPRSGPGRELLAGTVGGIASGVPTGLVRIAVSFPSPIPVRVYLAVSQSKPGY